ncbi:MAG TPA: ABC transporter substrate binding protein, partial [Polyangiaceae bacterium]
MASSQRCRRTPYYISSRVRPATRRWQGDTKTSTTSARWFASLLLFLQLCISTPAWAAKTRHVLVLNSYHPTYTWTRNIVDGAQSVLDKLPDVELSIEYMDTKKLYTPDYLAKLADVYAAKFANIHYDAVISTDDDALNFLLKYRDRLFPNVPVVFCGVNNFEDERIAGHAGITGVNEANDMRRNLEFIASTYSKVKHLAVVHDQSATGQSVARQLRAIQPQYAGRFSFEYITDVTRNELALRVAQLPSDTLILWGVFMRDKAGDPLSPKQSLGTVVGAAKVPVFSFWDFAIIEGAVGGYVVSGRHQGEAAAHMAERL